MNIRTATLDDLAAIAAIQVASPEASQWDPGGYLEHDCAVAVEQGRVTGFLSGNVSASKGDGNYWAVTVGIRVPL